MRARAAFISSLGTTGILVAAALLMLAVVSALVAFRGWPGGMSDSVASVPAGNAGGTPVALTQVRHVVTPKAAVVREVRGASSASRPSAAGLVKTTSVDRAPAGVVKVPPGVHMSLPPVATPTVRAPMQPASGPHIATDAPQHLLPPRPGGPLPDGVGNTIDQVVGPLPELDGGQGAIASPVTVEQGGDGATIGVTVMGTTVSLPLPR
ncbi:MAG: hypothetical protein QOG63_2490 [Thermoleophilaceae bacterium]|nr:hypothetical protein [Thermoleophilaceae bacterium]